MKAKSAHVDTVVMISDACNNIGARFEKNSTSTRITAANAVAGISKDLRIFDKEFRLITGVGSDSTVIETSPEFNAGLELVVTPVGSSFKV